jgi:hypothetical protein
MKNLIAVVVMAVSLMFLSGCADSGLNLDKLSACGECMEGLKDLGTAQSMQETLHVMPVTTTPGK